MNTGKILERLESGFERDLELVRRFLRTPSISYTGEGIKETGEAVVGMIESLGGSARLVKAEGGYHPVVFGRVDSRAPHTLLIYGMYDVMPAEEPGWIAPPFAAEIRDFQHFGPCIINRGATNTKGPLASFFNAMRAVRDVEGKLPVNLIFAIEGEEEYGSRTFAQFVKENLEELRPAGAMLFPFFGCDENGAPELRLGTKGILYFELACRGGDWGGPVGRGIHGSNNVWVASPVWRLITALRTMVDEEQRITVDGFFTAVRGPTAEDKELCAALGAGPDAADFLKANDVRRFKWGMQAEELFIHAMTQPQLNIDGIWGGYTGPGTKTLLPHEATVKMDVRMVPDQDPDEVVRTIRAHLDRRGFEDIEMRVINKYLWSKVSPREPVVQAMLEVYRFFGKEPALQPLNIGSAPFYAFDRILGIPYVFGGMGHGGRAHSSNEYCVVNGILDFEKSMVVFLDRYLEGAEQA